MFCKVYVFMGFKIIYYYLKLLRPLNVLISGLAMVVSASILDQLHNYYIVLLTSVVVMCFTAASNALNDAIDIKSDSINRPNRPISLGRVSINSAIFISFILYTAGSIICLNLPNIAQVIAIIISVPLMIIYNIYLKGLHLVGNFVVASILGMCFVFAGAAHGNVGPMWLPGILAFGLTFLREIIKDMADIDGDKISGLKTYPISKGLKKTTRLIIFISLIICSALFLPYLIGIYGNWYMIILFLGVEIPLFIVVFLFIKNPQISTAKICSKILKFSTINGLFAIYFGK